MKNKSNKKCKIYLSLIIEKLIHLDLWVLIKTQTFIKLNIPLLVWALKIFLYIICSVGLLYTFSYSLETKLYVENILEFFNLIIKSKEKLYLQFDDNLKSNIVNLRKELIKVNIETMHIKNSLYRMNLHFRNLYLDQKNMDENLADFASETVGGIVISTPNTQSYHASNSIQMIFFGIPIWKFNYYTPRKVIQPWSEAGECWAFRGSYGKIEIELAYTILIKYVTLEHILVSASITGKIDSAPKSFNVLGKINNTYRIIDTFIYKNEGLSSQTFEITNLKLKKIPFKRVILEILSNWGNKNYTCIYRFKVHGQISDSNLINMSGQ